MSGRWPVRRSPLVRMPPKKRSAGQKAVKAAGGSGWAFPDDVPTVPIPAPRAQSGFRGVGLAGETGGYQVRLQQNGSNAVNIARLPAAKVSPESLKECGMVWSQAMVDGSEEQQREYVRQYWLGVKAGRIEPEGCKKKRRGKVAKGSPAAKKVALQKLVQP